MRWISILVTAVITATVVLTTAVPAGAQSSLDEVKCSFFDEYVDSNFERDAAMPLAIAVAGDELPGDVSLAFAAIEDGRLIQPSQNDAIVAYFGPLCHTPANTAAASGVLTAPIAGRADPTATPDELATTGLGDTSLVLALVGIVLVMLGLMMPNLSGPKPLVAAQPSQDLRLERTSREPRHRFWLLDDNAS